MQVLQFELSWDKTISDIDRERIKKAFLETGFSNHRGVQLAPLWQAMNHRGELLVTVLIHNFRKEIISFQDKQLRYLEKNKIVAKHTFTLPNLAVMPKTSIPWTFIFPAERLQKDVTLQNGHLELVN